MRRRTLHSTSIVRSYNASAVLQTLHRVGSCSRSQLTELTRMSPATVSRITAQLIQKGIIVEERIGESTGGRPPVLLRLDYEKLSVIGVRLLRDEVSLGLFDLHGHALHKVSYVPYDLDPDFLLRELGSHIDEMLASGSVPADSHVLGLGVAVAGVVRSEEGIVVRSVNLGWRDVPIAERLEGSLDMTVFVENDANAGALAEVWFGGRTDEGDAESLMFVKTDTGVGAGLLLDQQLIAGARGMVGEIGHIPIVPGGHRCRCGQDGCLETYMYMPDVLGRYATLAGHSIDKHTFFDSGTKGDPIASRLIDEAQAALTLTLSAAAALLDLDKIVVDGAWGSFDHGFLQAIEERVKATIQSTGLEKTIAVRPSRLGDDGDLLGAVGLVSNRLFSPPGMLSNVDGLQQLTDQMGRG